MSSHKIIIRMGAGHNDLTLSSGDTFDLPTRELGHRMTREQADRNAEASLKLHTVAKAVSEAMGITEPTKKEPPTARRKGKPHGNKHHHAKTRSPTPGDRKPPGNTSGVGDRQDPAPDAPKKRRRRRSQPRPVPAPGQDA